MPKLKEQIDKLKSKPTSKVSIKDGTPPKDSIDQDHEDSGIFDFIIGSGLIALAFIFGRKK